jgi:rhamnogalacturonyl hydrolase YesR
MTELILNSFHKFNQALEKESIQNRFLGIDPFDGLNSPLITQTFLGNNKWVRLAFVQFFKRSPINLRRLVGIKAKENPQALAVFLNSYCLLYRQENDPQDLETIHYLAKRIIELKQNDWSGACWSYPFAWQARAFYQPANMPLIIPTAYCVNALLDAYELTGEMSYKQVAISSADFITKDLNRTYKGETFAFSYSPKDHSVVYNASLMSSQVLSRIYSLTGEIELKNLAQQSVKYCLEAQNPDGSWTYGEKSFHQWIDNFHSGYNLTCLQEYVNYCEDYSIEPAITKGLQYYLNTFFDKSGFSWYFANKQYPLDMNNPAQLVITLQALGKLNEHIDLVNRVLSLTIDQMQASTGWFYYQKNKLFTNKINYLRWSNAWMHYAFSLLKSNV